MKVAILLLSVVVLSQAESWVAAPYTLVKRAAQPEPQRGGSRPGTRFGFGRPSSSGQNTRFFTGNQAIDAGAAGSLSPTRCLTRAGHAAAPAARTPPPTTGSSAATPAPGTSCWAPPPGSPGPA